MSWFSCGSSILVASEFRDVDFCRGRKTGELGENTSQQGENQQQSQPTYDTGPESNRPILVGASAFTTASLLP